MDMQNNKYGTKNMPIYVLRDKTLSNLMYIILYPFKNYYYYYYYYYYK